MKKRLLLKLGLVALLGTGLFVAWLWWTTPTTGICRYTVSRIQVGMTEAEVVALIGLPSGLHGIDQKRYEEFEVSFEDNTAYLDIPLRLDVVEKVWASPQGRIHVAFDRTGRVAYTAYFGPRTITERIRSLWEPEKKAV
jgi:hypothetical protein